MKVFSTFKYQIILTVTALVWLLFVFFSLQLKYQNTIYPDASSYLKAGQLLAEGFIPHHYRPYGMAFYSCLPRIFGPGSETIFNFIKVVNVPVWLASILLLFSTLKFYTSNRKAFIFTLTYISCVGIVILNNLLLSEIPWITLLLIAIYGLTTYKFKTSYLWLVIGVSATIVSILVRPVSKFILVILLIVYWRDIWLLLKTNYKFLVLGSALLLVTQCSMMKKTYGDFTVSYIDYYTVHHYVTDIVNLKQLYNESNESSSFSEFKEGVYKSRDALKSSLIEDSIDYKAIGYSEQRRKAKAFFVETISNQPLAMLSIYGNNLYEHLIMPTLYVKDAKNIKETRLFPIAKNGFYWLSHFQNTGFSILGILSIFFSVLLILKKRVQWQEDKLMIFLTLTLSYTILILGLSAEQYDRLNIPNYAMIIILACIVIHKWKSKVMLKS